ncbi:MAG TPA: head GIN domain-containing protein [Mucilaginibacter sp.]|nr:head GIN domain-containing protein [Mucilaginibacter sp.]
MKKKLNTLLLFILLAGSSQLVTGQTIRYSTDSLVTINPGVSDFTELKVGGPVDIVITQGQAESLKLTLPAEVRDRIVAEVSGHTLYIHNKHDNWSQGEKSWYSDKGYWHRTHARIIAYLTVKNLNAITLAGSGTMKFDNGLNADHMKLTVRGSGSMRGKVTTKNLLSKISGSGSINISGNADRSMVNVAGSGNFTAPELVTSNSNIKVSGSGDAKVNAQEQLSAAVTGSGEVSYTGSATKIITNKSGSGSIRKF